MCRYPLLQDGQQFKNLLAFWGRAAIAEPKGFFYAHKMEKIIGIYKITSPKKRVYIGQSSNVKERWSSYKSLKCKGQPRLYKSLNKHGVNSHKFEIIHFCDAVDLNELEAYYIELYSSFNTTHGLNLRSGGGANTKCSDETKLKISESLKKPRVISKETRAKLSLASKNRTKETQDAINKNRKPISDETRAKLSKIHTGRKHTDESKKKMSLVQKGSICSEETRRKIGKANSNPSMETRLKMSISAKNMSIEKKLKISIANMGNTKRKGKLMNEYTKNRIIEANSMMVASYDINGKLIKLYSSQTEAAKDFGLTKTAICSYIRNGNAQRNGLTWKKITQ